LGYRALTNARHPDAPTEQFLSWLGIVRLGLVQTALGAIIVLTTSTLNRVMVVELQFAAMLPGALVALHYAIQILRPRWGYGSDTGGRRTPWIIGGMAVLALGGFMAAVATAWMSVAPTAGIALAVLAFIAIGVGVGASGTSLLVLLATQTAPSRRPAAASLVWIMMIAGFVVTATTAGALLDPYTHVRLMEVSGGVSLIAFIVTVLAVWGVEKSRASVIDHQAPISKPPFRQALAEVWREPAARRFTIFVFVSMLAYSAQDLILEPFAGLVFDFTPGQSTQLSGVQNGGVLIGMLFVGTFATYIGSRSAAAMRQWTIAGCFGSALALAGLAVGAHVGPQWPLLGTVFALGLANGIFAVAAISSMMAHASTGATNREGVRMGIWGAAQAIAFGLGGFIGTAAVDLARAFLETPVAAYSTVFASEALLFVLAALLAARVGWARDSGPANDDTENRLPAFAAGEGYLAENMGR
jgi:BCD family chlorophyll transporter-like MFS transporter